jgi:hypothetical protein
MRPKESIPVELAKWLVSGYREMRFEAISLLRIATEADRLLGMQTLPQSVSICFENK